jgi:HJR/Mrr/RecB family endonuclease
VKISNSTASEILVDLESVSANLQEAIRNFGVVLSQSISIMDILKTVLSILHSRREQREQYEMTLTTKRIISIFHHLENSVVLHFLTNELHFVT